MKIVLQESGNSCKKARINESMNQCEQINK